MKKQAKLKKKLKDIHAIKFEKWFPLTKYLKKIKLSKVYYHHHHLSWLDMKCPPKKDHVLKTWSPANGAIFRGSGNLTKWILA
jgi:hypothetical protein